MRRCNVKEQICGDNNDNDTSDAHTLKITLMVLQLLQAKMQTTKSSMLRKCKLELRDKICRKTLSNIQAAHEKDKSYYDKKHASYKLIVM